ncbi:hypothetical protein Peur_055517 [Populus x canadensis]
MIWICKYCDCLSYKLNSLRTCIGNFTDAKRTKANGGNHSHHKCKWAEVNENPIQREGNGAWHFDWRF